MAPDLLAISTSIAFEAPLISLESALSASLLQSGLRREDYLRRLMADLHQPRLQPLLWVLPRRWRLAPAQLPTQLHGLAQLLEQGLLSPALLAVLGDELAALGHLPFTPAPWSDGAVMGAHRCRPGLSCWRWRSSSRPRKPSPHRQ